MNFDIEVDPVEEVGWQKLWLFAQKTSWRSLALVPVGDGVPTPRIASVLAEVGLCHMGCPLTITDATGLTLDRLEASMLAIGECGQSRARTLIALGPVLQSPASVALAQAADASILCLLLGGSSMSEAAQTIEEIGRPRFLGSVIVRGAKESR